MSITSEITRISTNIASAYTACSEKGATMPDTQNSANLADTIESIPAGSETIRGAWVVPQEYLDMEDAIINTNWRDSSKFPNYVSGSTSNQRGFIKGFYLDKSIKGFCITSSEASEVLLADGTIITPNSNYIYHEFPEEGNWFIIATLSSEWVTVPYYLDTTGTPEEGARSSTTQGGTLASNMCTYYVFRREYDPSSSYTTIAENALSYTYYQHLDSFKVINTLFSGTISYLHAQTILQNNILKYYPPVSEFSTHDNFDPSASIQSYFNSNAYKQLNLPYGLDLSNYTASLTLGSSNTYENKIKQAYIKLPSASFTVKNDIVLSTDNWQYIADNAPIVSSKTLTCGALNIANMGGTSGTIYTTLTGKGWTIA